MGGYGKKHRESQPIGRGNLGRSGNSVHLGRVENLKDLREV